MTMAITAKAKQLKAEGKDVIGFGAGEPDFDTPDHIKQAAITALNNGVTKYAPAPGSNELRDAIVAKFARDNDLTYTRDQVIVNIGAKHTVFAALMVVVDRDDEVIIPAPFWVSYPEMVRCAEGKPVIVTAGPDQDFKITPDQLKAAITPKTRALILNSPSNPTGQVYSADELRALAEIAVEAGLVILSDEIYEKLLYDGATHQSVAALSDDIYNHTITINGMSKAFSMTGWRLGYAAGPQPIIKAMSSMQSHSTSNPVSFAMVGGVEALNAGYDFLPTFLEAFDRRRTHLVDALNAVDGITCAKPQGAFYVFPDASGLLGRSTPEGKTIATTMDLADYLLESVGVGVVPGEAFGAPGCMRLSYATSDANVEEGARRIAQAADKLQ
jgi:aspartate aminotransferase